MTNIPGIFVEESGRLTFSNISNPSNSRQFPGIAISLVSRVQRTVAKVARSIHSIPVAVDNTIMHSIAITIPNWGVLSNNRISLGSTIVDLVVLAISKDITMGVAVIMDKVMPVSFAISVNLVMTISNRSVLCYDRVGLGSAVVDLEVLPISKDIPISISPTNDVPVITPSLC